MNPQSAKQMLIDSDYPMDKIIYLSSGSFSVSATNTNGVAIKHNLPFIPLIGGNWSLTSTFGIAYEYGAGSYPSGNLGYPFGVQADVYADATNIYVNGQNVTGSAATIYYRVFGFEPTTSSSGIGLTAVSGDEYVVNSDLNLTKLYREGYINGVTTTSSVVRTPFVHGLGYIPQVLAWRETIYGTVIPMYYATPGNQAVVTSLIVNANEIITLTPLFWSDDLRIHYRIYIDE